VLGRNVNMLMPEPYHASTISTWRAISPPARSASSVSVARSRPGAADGTTFPVHLSVGEMTIDGEPKFTGILHDLTTRVVLETQLREQAALTRLGEMAAVVAHEVKNPLTGIRGAVQIIGSRLPSGSRDAEVVKEIVARIDALNDLMKDLLLFARPPQPRLAPIDLRPLLETVVSLARQDPGARAIAIAIAGTSDMILADAELLKLVIQNFLLNAVHAINGSGSIQVDVQTIGSICRVTVTDSGPVSRRRSVRSSSRRSSPPRRAARALGSRRPNASSKRRVARLPSSPLRPVAQQSASSCRASMAPHPDGPILEASDLNGPDR
jgi:signal transduction histidine kinase